MLEFQEKIKIKKFVYSKFTLVVLFISSAFLLNAVWKVYEKQDLTKDNLIKTAAGYESLRAREKMLSLEIERLKTQEGTEAEVREKYGLVKPGEEVIVMVDNDDSTSTLEVKSDGFWQRVFNWLK